MEDLNALWEKATPIKESEDLNALWEQATPIEAQPQEDIPWYESLGKGAIQGATLGFADELRAGLATKVFPAVGEFFGTESAKRYNEYFDSPDEYEHQRDIIREENKRAEEANPGSYLGGQIVGGAGALLPGAAAASTGVLPAMAYGARLGALSGAGYSEGDFFERPQDVALDMVTGGAIGSVIPGAAGLAGKVVGGTSNQIVKTIQQLADDYIPGSPSQKGSALLEAVDASSAPKMAEIVKKSGLSEDEVKKLASDWATKSGEFGPPKLPTTKQVVEDIGSTAWENVKGLATGKSQGAGLIGALVGNAPGVAGMVAGKTVVDAAPAIARLAQPAVKYGANLAAVTEKLLASPVRVALRGAPAPVIDNVLSQTDPEYREAKRKAQEEDNE